MFFICSLLIESRCRFSQWCRPMTPVGYLFTTALVTIILLNYAGLNEIISKEFKEFSGQWALDLMGPGVDTVNAIAIELIISLTLFLTMSIYRRLLGVTQKQKSNFFEFHVYSTVQYIILTTIVFYLAALLIASATAGASVWGGAFLAISFLYFLWVPLKVFPARYGVRVSRIILSYFVMLLFVCLLCFLGVFAAAMVFEALN